MIQASRCGFLFVWIYLPNRSSRRREAEASSMLKPKFPLALRLWKNFEIWSRCRHDYLKRQTPSIKYVLADHSPQVAIEQVLVRSLLVVPTPIIRKHLVFGSHVDSGPSSHARTMRLEKASGT